MVGARLGWWPGLKENLESVANTGCGRLFQAREWAAQELGVEVRGATPEAPPPQEGLSGAAPGLGRAFRLSAVDP